MEYKIKNTTYIDSATGEVTGQFSKKIFSVFTEEGYKLKLNNHKIISYQDLHIADVLDNDSDLAKVTRLSRHIHKTTNCIGIIKGNKTVMANEEDMAIILKISLKNTKEFISRMVKMSIIAKGIFLVGNETIIKYYMNPLYFNSAKNLSADIYFLFETSIKEHLLNQSPKNRWVINKFNEIKNSTKLGV